MPHKGAASEPAPLACISDLLLAQGSSSKHEEKAVVVLSVQTAHSSILCTRSFLLQNAPCLLQQDRCHYYFPVSHVSDGSHGVISEPPLVLHILQSLIYGQTARVLVTRRDQPFARPGNTGAHCKRVRSRVSSEINTAVAADCVQTTQQISLEAVNQWFRARVPMNAHPAALQGLTDRCS